MRIGRIPGLGAALTVATVTIAVFGTFQNYGPESAVRRFHHAIATNNPGELSQVVVGPLDSSALNDLRGFALTALRASGADYRIVKSDRTPTQVRMLAIYEGRLPVVWVVVKTRDRWRIDPYLTLQGMRKLGFP